MNTKQKSYSSRHQGTVYIFQLQTMFKSHTHELKGIIRFSTIFSAQIHTDFPMVLLHPLHAKWPAVTPHCVSQLFELIETHEVFFNSLVRSDGMFRQGEICTKLV